MDCLHSNCKLLIFMLAVSPNYVKAYGNSGVRETLCTEERYNECVQHILEFYDDVNRNIVPTILEHELHEECQNYENSMECFAAILHSCPRINRSLMDGVDRAFSWLCDEARTEYIRYRNCFSQPQLHQEGRFCNSTLNERIASINPAQDLFYQYERHCQYYNDYLDCFENTVISFCGEEAGSWQRQMLTRLLQPVLAHSFCELHDDGAVYYGGGPAGPHLNLDDDDKDKDAREVRKMIMIAAIILLGSTVIIMAVTFGIRKTKVIRVAARTGQTRHSNRRGDVGNTARNNAGARPAPNMRYVATVHGGLEGPAVYTEPLPEKPGMGAPLEPGYPPPGIEPGMAPVEAPNYRNINSPPPGYSY